MPFNDSARNQAYEAIALCNKEDMTYVSKHELGDGCSQGSLDLRFWPESYKMACCSFHQLSEEPAPSSLFAMQASSHLWLLQRLSKSLQQQIVID